MFREVVMKQCLSFRAPLGRDELLLVQALALHKFRHSLLVATSIASRIPHLGRRCRGDTSAIWPQKPEGWPAVVPVSRSRRGFLAHRSQNPEP